MTRNNRHNLGLILFMLICLSACETEFVPHIDKYENLLVVDGLLTNGPNPVEVKLSVSSPVYEKKYIPLSGAELYLSDQDQSVVLLSETAPGIYKAADASFRGQEGSTYLLHISLADGRKYISDAGLLRPTIPIDTVYGLAENPVLGEIKNEYAGIQFYVENHKQSLDTSYYLWRLSQTHKYRSTFDIDYTWEGEYFPYPNPDSLRTCWRTANVDEIIFASTKYLDQTAINRFPINYVSTDTKLLSIRYSLLVKQLNISKEVHDFYFTIEQQNYDQGDLWSKQPIQIRGNIHRLDNPDEPVLGYFVVGGVSEKRVFVDRPDIPFYYTECTPDFDLRWVPFEPSSSWPIYIDDLMFLGWVVAERKACFDCRLDGGNIDPPEFWEE